MDQPSQYFSPASEWTANVYAGSQQQRRNHQAHQETILHESDLPMDDFDKALLAEPIDAHQTTAQTDWGQISSCNPVLPVASNPDFERGHQGNLGGTGYSYPSQSSPVYPNSSPSISALQKRQHLHHRTEHGRLGELPRTPASTQYINASYNAANPRTWLPLPLQLGHAPLVVQGIQLIELARLPDQFRALFKFPLFNAVQSKCFAHAYEGNDNLVLSAPTGSGKTAVMELAICRLLLNKQNEDFKVVYQAPTKSLCSERYKDWSAKLRGLGLQCAELTGDVELSNLKNVQQADVIIATPEKWDSVTRKWNDNAKLMRMIKLFLVDEVHILKETRGATMEAVVSRMKSVGSGIRFVALSATLPNSEDIATWLGLNSLAQHLPANREVFGESFRPTTLERHVIGFQGPPNDFILDSMLVKEVPAIIARYSRKKPVMIFCPTQKSAMKMARSLAELWLATAHQSRLWNAPRKEIKAMNVDLQKFATASVAFHHGSLDVADRQAVENGFLQGDINVICCTSTLAVGVNLPCYLVILKGTSCYTDTGLQEYSILEVMQMLGRAGRPQFETSACAVILTGKDKVSRYEKLVAGQDVLESSLHENLIEHLNAEIGIGTITDILSAVKWLRSTFLHVRVSRNPSYYKFQHLGLDTNEDNILEALCKKNLEVLESACLIEKTQGYHCTEYGLAMARYYVKLDTMRSLMAIPPRAKQSEILDALTRAIEFRELRWKTGEKGFYKKVNKSNEIRYPIKVDIALPSHKASLVAQASLGGYILDKDDAPKFNLQLQQDIRTVLTHANRLVRCVIDIQLSRKDAATAKNALELARSLAAKVWDDTSMQLKQIEGIGDVTARKLASHGITSIEKLSNTESHRIDLVLGKNPPFGSNLLSRVSRFPSLLVTVKEVGKKRKTNDGAELKLRCEVGRLNESATTYFNKKLIYICFLCETAEGELLDFRRFGAARLSQVGDFTITINLERPTSRITCHVMCDEIAGTHRYAEIKPDIPICWFRFWRTSSGNQNSDRQPDVENISDHSIEDFAEIDIPDEDFLTAETKSVNHNNAPVDIDSAVPAQVSDQENSHIPKRKVVDIKDKDEDAHWREPIQLANGNWTCQHTCNDEKKPCKHQCCKEGVKKPKKRPKLDPSAVCNNKPITPSTLSASKHNISITGAKQRTIQDILESLPSTSHTPRSNYGNVVGPMNCPGSFTSMQQKKATAFDKRCPGISSDSLPDIEYVLSEVTAIDHVDKQLNAGKENLDLEDFEDVDLADCDWNMIAVDSTGDGRKNVTPSTAEPDKTAFSNSPSETSNMPSEANSSGCMKDATLFTSTRANIHQKVSGCSMMIPEGSEDSELAATSSIIATVIERGNQTRNTANQEKPDQSGTELPRPKRDLDGPVDPQCPETETEEEREKREHEEDQRKKWAEFEPWMYEEFGDYVDII